MSWLNQLVNNKKVRYAVVISAFFVKLIYGLYDLNSATPVADEKDYIYEAELILENGPFSVEQRAYKTFVGPGYPWLLSIAKLLGSESLMVWLNAFLSTLVIILIYRIGRFFMSSEEAGLAGFWALVYLPYSIYIGTFLKETLLQFLVVWSFYLLFKLQRAYRLQTVVTLGFCLMYLVHTDERYLLFFPVYVLGLMASKDISFRKRLKQLAAVVLWFLIFSSPWAIRNYIVFERPILITERFQAPIDNVLGVENALHKHSDDFRLDAMRFRDSILAGHKPVAVSSAQKAVEAAMKSGLVPHDFNLWEKIWYNSISYASPWRTKDILIAHGWKYWPARSTLGNLVYMLNFGILLPFLVFGIFLACKNRVPELKVLTLYLFLHYVLHIIMISGSGRYRHPVDFIIILLAFYGLSGVRLAIRKKRASAHLHTPESDF